MTAHLHEYSGTAGKEARGPNTAEDGTSHTSSQLLGRCESAHLSVDTVAREHSKGQGTARTTIRMKSTAMRTCTRQTAGCATSKPCIASKRVQRDVRVANNMQEILAKMQSDPQVRT